MGQFLDTYRFSACLLPISHIRYFLNVRWQVFVIYSYFDLGGNYQGNNLRSGSSIQSRGGRYGGGRVGAGSHRGTSAPGVSAYISREREWTPISF